MDDFNFDEFIKREPIGNVPMYTVCREFPVLQTFREIVERMIKMSKVMEENKGNPDFNSDDYIPFYVVTLSGTSPLMFVHKKRKLKEVFQMFNAYEYNRMAYCMDGYFFSMYEGELTIEELIEKKVIKNWFYLHIVPYNWGPLFGRPQQIFYSGPAKVLETLLQYNENDEGILGIYRKDCLNCETQCDEKLILQQKIK